MDVLATRLAKDANAKSKSTKKVKRLSKDDNNKSKTKLVPKVDSSKIGKVSKKPKVKNVVTDLPLKKKQIIKDMIKSQNNENEILVQKVTNVKNKKSKAGDIKQKVKDVKKSLKDVISKPDKVGKKNKKNIEVLKNKINLQTNVTSSLNVTSSKKGPDAAKNKKVKNVEPELVKDKKVKKVVPEIVKTKKNKKSETIQPTLSKNVKAVKTENTTEEKSDVLDKKKKLKLSKKLKSKNAKLINVENNEEIKSIKSKKRKVEDIEEEDLQSSVQPTLTKKEILNYVHALLKVAANDAASKNSLFDSEKPPILLSVVCIKVPKVALHQMRISLPHSMVTDNDEIVLFVKDLKKGRRRDYEDTVHHYEDLLQQHGCTRVKTIIPINQVKTEYRQFEMRRRLLNSYDYFLADGRISGHLAHLLGKTFRLKRKLPTSIHMDKKDLKEEIEGALKKTSLEIHSTGDSSIAQVATCSMSAREIAENIMAVVNHISEHFPGGWGNIRSLSIKTPLSLAIPIYMTLKSRNTVKVPVVNPKRPKAYKDVEGELSTFTKNVSVKVAADGTVDLQQLGGNDSDLEDDEEAEKEVSEETEKKIKKEKIKKSKDDDVEDEEEDDEEEENDCVDNEDEDDEDESDDE